MAEFNQSNVTVPVTADTGSGNQSDPYAHCEDLHQFWQKRQEKAIHLYVFPIVIIGGSLLNLVAIAVLQTRVYRKTSTGFLMSALAVADLGLLLTGIMRKWIQALTDSETDIRTFSSAGCKTHIFFTYFFQYVSSWTLALITIERAICVCKPFRCKELCSLKKIVLAFVFISVMMFFCNAHFFWMYEVTWADNRGRYMCHGNTRYYKFLYDGWHNWIDLVVPCLAPFGVIITCNVIIVYKLISGVSDRKNMTSASKSTASQTSSTTVMLLCVSTMFLLLVTPFVIFTLGESYGHWPNETPLDCAKLDLAYTYVYLLFNINSAVNFLLYCVSGTKFRKVIVSLMCPGLFERSGKVIMNSQNVENNARLSTTGLKKPKFTKKDQMENTLFTTLDKSTSD